ncbi:MAG: methyl-accepting chemotaxis protein [Campylobacterota bacterium]|nr:methyl-accepting chemotaxis protein [Campylobacterota bacterium]
MKQSIGKKLGLSYIFLFLTTLIVGVIAIISLSSLSNVSSSLLKDELPQKVAISNTISNAKDFTLAIQMVIYDKQDYVEHHNRDNLNKAIDKLSKSFNILESGVSGAGMTGVVPFNSKPLTGEALQLEYKAKSTFNEILSLKDEIFSFHMLKTSLYFNKKNQIMHIEELFHQLLESRAVWYSKLSSSALYDSKFNGLFKYEDTMFYKWYESFKNKQKIQNTNHKDIKKLYSLLEYYNKNVKRVMNVARLTNNSSGKIKQNNLKKVGRYVDRLNKINKDILLKSYEILTNLEKQEHYKYNEISNKTKQLNQELFQIKASIQNNIEQKELNISNSEESSKLFLIITIIISIIISIAIAIYMTKNILKSINILQLGLNNFFKYLNKETSSIEPIKISSHDEFKDMAEKINNSIYEIENNIKLDNRLILDTESVATSIKDGSFSSRISSNANSPELNRLKDVINDMLNTIEINIKQVMNILSQYALYDYTHRTDTNNISGDIKKLCEDVNIVGDVVTNILKENQNIANELKGNSEMLSSSVDTLSLNSSNQAKSLQETSASITQIASTLENTNQIATNMQDNSKKTQDASNYGEKLAIKTVESMEQISQQVNLINEAITIIDHISFQTNILSLNAAVEAATAGEAGKGFAVVAQEVRNLASRSADAANEIKDLVENANKKAIEGKDISSDMIDGFKTLSELISNSYNLVENISTSSKEQSTAINQISDTLQLLDSATQENAQTTQSTNNIAKKTNNLAEQIVENTNKNKF